jgi:hypothetical protein
MSNVLLNTYVYTYIHNTKLVFNSRRGRIEKKKKRNDTATVYKRNK